MSTIFRLTAVLTLMGAASVALLAQAPSTAPSRPTLAGSDYVIGAHDVLTIQRLIAVCTCSRPISVRTATRVTRTTLAIESDGTFTFPLIGRV